MRTRASDGPAQVAISVDPGPLFTFAEPKAFLTDGTFLSLEEFGIKAGEPARSQLILDAEDALIDRYQHQGHPFAKSLERSIEADHKTKTLDVSLTIATGPKARLGGTSVSGATSVDPVFIRKHAHVPEGEPYSPDELQAAAKRLRALGIFDSVIVQTGEAVDANGSVPVLVEVSERKHRTIGAGATLGNLDGVGLEAFWTHRNLFGRAEQLRVEGSVARIGQDQMSEWDYHGGVLFSKPGALGPASTFEAELSADFTNPDAYQKRAIGGEVAIRHEFNDQISGRAGLHIEYARIKDTISTETNLLTSVPLELAIDTRDSKLDPTEGFQLMLESEPTINSENGVTFLKNSATASGYVAIDKAKRFVLAGKVSAGSIIGASKGDVPADRRFYAGGGGSIRGYAYQMAGPRDADNKPEGGRSYALMSLETRVRMTDTIGLAAFVDTGSAFDSTLPEDDGDWYTGVGAGIRYLTPVGPLRLDVAIPLNEIKDEPQYGVYLGLGQAF